VADEDVATALKELLLEIKGEVERVSGEGANRLPDDRLASLTVSYDKLVAEGLEAPPPELPEQ
jgi:hypothetical protein